MEDCLYRVSVKAIIMDDKQRMLLLQYAAGLWGLPGGGMEYKETPQEAVVRECKEELGIDVRDVSDLPVRVATDDITRAVWSCKLFYTATLDSGQPLEYEEDIIEAKFMSLAEIRKVGLVGSGIHALQYLEELLV